jgi:hypothetical protein
VQIEHAIQRQFQRVTLGILFGAHERKTGAPVNSSADPCWRAQ